MKFLGKADKVVKTTTILFFIFSLITSCNENKKEVNFKSPQAEKKVVKTIYGYNIDSVKVIKNIIKQNQNLSDILSSYHASYQIINKLALAAKSVYDVRKLATNKEYEIICTKDSSHQAKCMIYHPNSIDYIVYKFCLLYTSDAADD